MLLNPLQFHAPKTASEAARLIAELDNAKVQAGGTFLLNNLKLAKRKGSKTPEHVISLRKASDLKGVDANDNDLIIRSMTTISELKDAGELTDNFTVFKTVCKNISTEPIRNMATVGGNLTCRYTWTEMPAAMIGMNATMHFLDSAGKETSMPAEDFFKAQAKTDKLFTHVTVPRQRDMRWGYQRVRKSQTVDIPLLSLIITTIPKGKTFSQTRVAVNNCVTFAKRDKTLEEFLNGKNLEPEVVSQALDHLDENLYDTRSSDYKKHMFRVCIKNALTSIIS